MAFEIAQQLRRRNQEVGLLALLDTVMPAAYLHPEVQVERLDTSDSAMVQEIISRKNFSVREDISTLTPEEQLAYVLEEGKKAHFVPADTDLERFRRLRHIHLMNVHAIKSYTPEVYPGQIDMFRAVESMEPEVPVQESAVFSTGWTLTGGWEALTSEGVMVHEIPGKHKEMMSEPNVHFVANALKVCLERVESRAAE
jgi:thioesterase domain-containing protein